MGFTPNHPFVHRVFHEIVTIHFGGKIPLFLGWHPFGPSRNSKFRNLPKSGCQIDDPERRVLVGRCFFHVFPTFLGCHCHESGSFLVHQGKEKHAVHGHGVSWYHEKRHPSECGLPCPTCCTIKIWMFPKIGVPQNGWFLMENPTLLKLMIWGYHYFWKHPCCTLCTLVTEVEVVSWFYMFNFFNFLFSPIFFASWYSPDKQRLEPEDNPFEKGNHVNQTSIFRIPAVSFQGVCVCCFFNVFFAKSSHHPI